MHALSLILIVLLLFILERVVVLYFTSTPKGKIFFIHHRIFHPNTLTILRMPMGIVSAFLAYNNYWYFSTLWFSLWMLTDLSDGTIARSCNLESKKGKWLDPLSDKCMTFPILIYFAFAKNVNHNLNSLAVILFLIIDTIGQLSRLWITRKGENWYGKCKKDLVTFLLAIIEL